MDRRYVLPRGILLQMAVKVKPRIDDLARQGGFVFAAFDHSMSGSLIKTPSHRSIKPWKMEIVDGKLYEARNHRDSHAGKTPPYVPWNIGLTKEAREKLQEYYGCNDLDETLKNHFLRLGSDISSFSDLGDSITWLAWRWNIPS